MGLSKQPKTKVSRLAALRLFTHDHVLRGAAKQPDFPTRYKKIATGPFVVSGVDPLASRK